MEYDELIQSILGKETKIIGPLMGGMMNQSYIVESKGKKYVIYFPTMQANEMVNRYLEKDNYSLVYKLGLTSKNVYFDPDTGIKVNEYIEGQSLDHVEDIDLNRVAGLLKYLHNSPIPSHDDYRPFQRFHNYEKEAKSYDNKINKDYEILKAVLDANQEYLTSIPLRLCHNDAQKSNIVKEKGTGKYYLIDFEFMGNNDPIYDIAAYGNSKVSEGRKLLDAYFDKPDQDEINRFYLWRIFLSLQWYNVAIVKHYRGEGVAHNYNFLEVAKFFLNNAKDAYKGFLKENGQ